MTNSVDSTRSSKGFDVILGNPPFLNQLDSATVSEKGTAALLQVMTGGVIRGYTDLSATFLLASTRMCCSGGRVAQVQPQSLLAAKDAGPVRSSVLDDASLAQLWVSNEHVFESASVFTCAPTIERDGPRTRPLSRLYSGSFQSLPDIQIDNDQLKTEETWAHLVAAALGIPEFIFSESGTIDDLATATADFRDQYYGLDGFLIDHQDIETTDTNLDISYPPIVTTGLIDLAVCDWGGTQTRILKKPWAAPRIDREKMRSEGTLSDWITSRLLPKLILATQTKVLEVYVDEHGRFVPSLPLISVYPNSADDLWRVAAAIASPVCVAIAMQKYSGAALSVNAIKLSAKQTLALPIPEDGGEWDKAAELFQQAQEATDTAQRQSCFIKYAEASIGSFRVPKDQSKVLLEWWLQRLGIEIDHGVVTDAK